MKTDSAELKKTLILIKVPAKSDTFFPPEKRVLGIGDLFIALCDEPACFRAHVVKPGSKPKKQTFHTGELMDIENMASYH